MNLDPRIAAEASRRLRARTELQAWAEHYGQDKGWVAMGAHHKLLVAKLQALVDGNLKHSESGKPVRNLIFLLPPGSAKPVAAGSRVLMATGEWKAIEQIAPGEKVIGKSGTACPVTAVHSQGLLPCLRICTEHGRELVLEASHPVLTNAGWKEAGKLEVGELLALMAAPVLQQGTTEQRKARAALAGYLIGDGSITQGRNQYGGLNQNAVITNTDLELIGEIARVAQQAGFTATIKEHAKKAPLKKVYTVLLSDGVRPWLLETGMGGQRSQHKRIPSFVITGSLEEQKAFLGAYFACDGSVYSKKGRNHTDHCTVDCVTVSPALGRQLQSLFLRFGIATVLRSHDTKHVRKDGTKSIAYRITAQSNHDAWRFKELFRGYLVGEKHRRFDRFQFRQLRIDQLYLPDRIAAIEPAGLHACHCLTVDRDASFVAEDIVVHNSQYASIIFPAWFITRRPHSRVLACSFSASLIEGFSRDCRNAIEAHAGTLGYSLLSDSRAIQEWSTTNGSRYRCLGVGAALSGYRADLGIIDDYIGSEEDADSQLMRDKIWQWYVGDFWPRLKPGACQVIVANRRHEDDLVGRILTKESADWEVVKIPFFARDNDPLGRAIGDRLWPEWFTLEMAEKIKTLPPRIQAGLYQQEPAPDDGNYFKKEWLLTYERDEYDRLMLSDPRIYGAADWAVSEEKDANRTCFGCAAMDSQGFLYILPDLFWKVSGPQESLAALIDLLKRRQPLNFWSERGHISKAWGPFLREQMLEQRVYSTITEVTPAYAKDIRARSIQGRMSMLRVKFPAFASWWPAALHELLSFPAGKTDDFVDFLAHLGAGVNSMVRTIPKEPVDFNKETPLTLTWLRQSHKERERQSQPRYQGR